MKDTPVFDRAAAAAPHTLAAEAGRTVLAMGGNAVEAMIAMASTIAVVYPHMNGVGGDGFWLIREKNGKVRALEAAGAAGSLATISRYRDLGYAAIPSRGIHAALTVPGTVGGWTEALALAAAMGGRLPLRDLFADAIRHAREGVPMSPGEAAYALREEKDVLGAPGFADVFMQDGKRHASGEIRRFPALAATLEHLAHAGTDDFYRGDVAREIAADAERFLLPFTRADLERQKASWREPLSVRIPGAVLFNQPPPSQGLAHLLMLGIHARLGDHEAESFGHIHALVEAAKRAWRIRDAVVTDFDRLTHDPQSFLAPDVLEREAALVSGDRSAPFPLPPLGDGDTIWMGCIDAAGNAVSFIQSLFWEYGSGVVLPRTGVLLQNRGRAFSLDPRSKNPLEPGRRPFHTLNTPLAVFDDGRVMSYGTMGGDPQPQISAQTFVRHALYGVPISEALDRPRFSLSVAWGAERATLKLEDRFDPDVVRALEKAGHVVESFGKPYANPAGHAGILVRDPRNGSVAADHDPRADGGAAGI